MNEQTLSQIKYIAILGYVPFAALINYTGLSKVALESLSLLIVLDLITGILKTINLKKKPTSTRLANGIFSKLVLLFIPIVVALAVKGLGLDFKILIDTTLSILILSETYSIIGNIYTIRTKQEVEEFDVVSQILKILRKKINQFLGDKNV